VALVHPPLEMVTAKSRQMIGDSVPLDAAITHWASTAALVAGLYEEDWELLSRALVDRIAEPVRKAGVPGFDEARAAALDAGALGAGLSGSGPSLFALCRSVKHARAAGDAMAAALAEAGVPDSSVYAGPVGRSGARIIEATSQWS
jgi:homoserine kinase